jgi:hypothetical protein
MKVSNTGGTTPTLNLYFQTGYGLGVSTFVNDLISFAQVTASPSSQVATMNFEAGAAAPNPATNGTLTVDTVNNSFGPGDQLLLDYGLTGTLPVYTVNVWGYCY